MPSAPIKQAKTTRAKAIMITWLIPIMILGRDNGIFILNKSCNLDDPNDVADSMVSAGTCLIPLLVSLIMGGIA